LLETTVDDIVASDHVLKEVSGRCGIPIKYVCGRKQLLDALPETVGGERFPLTLYLRDKWL